MAQRHRRPISGVAHDNNKLETTCETAEQSLTVSSISTVLALAVMNIDLEVLP